MSIRDMERTLLQEQVDLLKHLAATMTEVAGRWSGQIVNNVLQVATAVFPAEGYITAEYGAAIGAVTVTNLDDAVTITVVSGGASGSAPSVGTGVHRVPPRASVTVPIAGHQFTIYGTAADEVSWVAYTAAARPVSG